MRFRYVTFLITFTRDTRSTPQNRIVDIALRDRTYKLRFPAGAGYGKVG